MNRIKFVISFIVVILLTCLLYSEKKGINYEKILKFEDIKYWKGLVADKKVKVEGKYSGKWENPLKVTRVDCKTVPKDWSKYNAIRLWIHSNKAKNFKFALIIQSENLSTDGWDYYIRHFIVDWKGWKEFIVPFENFETRRSVVGWHKIDRIRFASTGYAISGPQPDDVILNFDDIELIKLTEEFKKKREKSIMGFESISAWQGLKSSSRYIKEGEFSGKWENTDKITRINCTDLPSDWSRYNALQLWIYSEKANQAGFEIVIISDNPATPKDDYFRYSVTVNWEGWKKFVIPFDSFSEKYHPAGWHKIDKVRFAALGYGHTPKKDTTLYFDDFALVNIEVSPKVIMQKHFYDGNEYINYFKIALKNVGRKDVKYRVDIKKPPYFEFDIKNRRNKIKKGEVEIIELEFKPKKINIKKVVNNVFPYKEAEVIFRTKNSEERLYLKVYFPFKIKYEHPYILFRKEDIPKLAAKVKNYEWAKRAAEKLKETADKYSSGSIPKETGGDYHERYGDYDVTRKHINFARAARYYGILYHIYKDKKLAKKGKDIIAEYTEIYPELVKTDREGKRGDSADPSGGKICVQLLTDAKWDIFISQAYDLLYQFFTPKEHKKIEYILRDQAEMLMSHKRGIHNFQAVYNSALAVIGCVLQDPAYLDYALNDPSNGFLGLQLKKSFTKDKLYYERSPHYHHFIISYITYLLDAVYNSLYNIWEEKGVKDIYDVLLKITDKEYEVPWVNDGGYFNFKDQKRGWPYMVAYARYKDKNYLRILDNLSRTSPEALLYVPGEIYEQKQGVYSKKKYEYKSFILPDTDWAFLRADKSDLGDFYLMFKYDEYYSSHTHLDRLGLIIKAFDKFIMPDGGSVRYGHPYQIPYFRSTISHNTLIVDKTPHSLTATTKLKYFYSSPSFQVVGADCYGINSSSDVLYKREVFLIDNAYVFDYVRVDDMSGATHTYDLVYHFIGEPDYKSFEPLERKNIYANHENYRFIDDFGVDAFKGEKDIVIDYNLDNIKTIRFWHQGQSHLKIITGKTPIANKKERVAEDKVPLIILRYDGKSADFSTVIQPYFKNKNVPSKIVKFDKVKEYNLSKLYKIKRKDGSIEYIFISQENHNPFSFNNLKMEADTAYLKVHKDKIMNISIVNGKMIKYKNYEISATRPVSVSITYLSNENQYLVKNMSASNIYLKLKGFSSNFKEKRVSLSSYEKYYFK